MRIGIIGAGRMGRALGARWARAGHLVSISFSHDQKKLERIAKELGNGARATTPAEAVRSSDALFLAVQWGTVDAAFQETGSLEGKTMLTCVIPATPDDTELAIGHTTSGAEKLAQRSGAKVVAIFNTITSELLSDEQAMAHVHPDVVYCGDDDSAKTVAAQLARDAGVNPIDGGALRIARYLEPFGMLIAQLAYNQEFGETLGYRIVLPAGEP
jgi:predicted dinucleotide-binding enzyme